MNSGQHSFDRIELLKDSYKTYDVKTADVNSDGWIDIVFANSDDFNLYLINNFKNQK